MNIDNKIDKYLNESSGSYILPKSRKKYITGRKILDKMEMDLEKATNKFIEELEGVAEEEYNEILSGLNTDDTKYKQAVKKIGEELEDMFDGTNSTLSDDFGYDY